ncbi:MAG: substrate-binding domain-containing protein, partial [Lautropia sp.]
SILPVAISPAALAIRSGAPRPVIARDVDLYAALRQAGRIGYSTGPSGTALLARLDRAGLLAELKPRLVLAPVGVPVATLLREGAADVAIQQLSELADRDGVEVVGPLPPGVAIDTTFSAAVAEQAADPGAAYDFIAYLTSPQVHGAIRRAHMAPAGITPGETA